MKFIVSSTALATRISAASRVINPKSTLPILECFLLELDGNTLTITAADTETVLISSVEVTESEGNGRIAIPARTLLESLKEIPEQPLTFSINPITLQVTVDYQNGKYNLMGQNPDEYPNNTLPGADANNVEIGGPLLLSGINYTLFATAEDELRPVMNGIYFDMTENDITFVSSDGHKLVRFNSTAAHADGRAAFILPKKPAGLLRGLLSREEGVINMTFDKRNATFTMEGYSLTCRLSEGRYPNYNSVIPKQNPFRVVTDRLSLLGAFKRVSVFTSPSSSLVKLHLTDNQVMVSTQDYDFSTSAEETVSCQYDGDEMMIGFKANFVIDILSNLPGNEVVIQLADPSRAGILTPAEQSETEDLIMLIMPMMINE